MAYKVFLVEDEIVAREGMRDNVNWRSVGYEFCGEAPDGEIALPLIQAQQPDVLITDIQMPFMDGLQLARIVREQMPDVKIIILSGYDEFEYAQQAVKLGVTEYLLKPINVQDIQAALRRVAETLDAERHQQANVQALEAQVANNRAALREKFLLKLVMGGIAPTEAIERGQELDLNVMAAHYLVMFLKIRPQRDSSRFDYHAYQDVYAVVESFLTEISQILAFKKDLDEIVIILKENREAELMTHAAELSNSLQNRVVTTSECKLHVGIGSPQTRLGGIHQSFVDALSAVEADSIPVLQNRADINQLLKLDRTAVSEYLRLGIKEEFDEFFHTAYLQPLSEVILESRDIKNYIFSDVVLTTAKFVEELGGCIEEIIPDMQQLETQWLQIHSFDQLQEEIETILLRTLAYRDDLMGNKYADVIRSAKLYMDANYTNPDLTLNDVAEEIGFSSSHFSTVFSRETGETFKEYLTKLRINKAQELLRTTNLKSFEIAQQVGYSDPHYFSHVFKKQTGKSSKQFRSQA